MLKLSRVEIAREPALAKIDAYFAKLVTAEIGPFGLLHAIKRMQAATGGGLLVNGDSYAILERVNEQDLRLAEIENRRLALKRRVREAVTSAEIAHVIDGLTTP